MHACKVGNMELIKTNKTERDWRIRELEARLKNLNVGYSLGILTEDFFTSEKAAVIAELMTLYGWG